MKSDELLELETQTRILMNILSEVQQVKNELVTERLKRDAPMADRPGLFARIKSMIWR